jgi:tetratricopeptide (TPR) repeat protein
MRFCPHCGAPLMAGAKFCIECGKQLGESGPSAAASTPKASKPKGSGFQLTNSFIGVFFGIVILGLAAAAYILSRPLPQNSSTQGAASSAGQGASNQNASGMLPPGHPKIELPTEARSFIDQVEQNAKAKPNDVAAWVKLGTVSMRAALFDRSYYTKAADAFAHVLKLDPDNLDALRGIGDIDYDSQKYDQAIAVYEHYLKKKPDDPEVRTDLGTMYLYTGNADQAVIQYEKAIAQKPDFFQAYYNLGVAYGEQGNKKKAVAALTKAASLAPDEDRRKQTEKTLEQLTGAKPSAEAASAPPAAPGAAAKNDTFHGAVEQMLRNLPVAGQRVSAVEWPGEYRAKVLLDNLPLDSIPPFARVKLMGDIKAGIDSAKAAHNVTSKVELDLVDGQSGRVMKTVTE